MFQGLYHVTGIKLKIQPRTNTNHSLLVSVILSISAALPLLSVLV